jgi:hypothetical protein
VARFLFLALALSVTTLPLAALAPAGPARYFLGLLGGLVFAAALAAVLRRAVRLAR